MSRNNCVSIDVSFLWIFSECQKYMILSWFPVGSVKRFVSRAMALIWILWTQGINLVLHFCIWIFHGSCVTDGFISFATQIYAYETNTLILLYTAHRCLSSFPLQHMSLGGQCLTPWKCPQGFSTSAWLRCFSCSCKDPSVPLSLCTKLAGDSLSLLKAEPPLSMRRNSAIIIPQVWPDLTLQWSHMPRWGYLTFRKSRSSRMRLSLLSLCNLPSLLSLEHFYLIFIVSGNCVLYNCLTKTSLGGKWRTIRRADFTFRFPGSIHLKITNIKAVDGQVVWCFVFFLIWVFYFF